MADRTSVSPVFLSAADRQIEGFLPSHALERSLVLTILFEEAPALVTDIFIYISGQLEKHLRRTPNGKSLFEAGLRHGRVIAALRKDSFLSTHTHLAAELKIQGMRPDALETARRLEKLPASDSLIGWPDPDEFHIGAFYEHVLRALLQQDAPPPAALAIGGERLEALWQETEPLRSEVLDRAFEFRHRSEKGVRRGDVLNATAEFLRFPRTTIDDVGTIVRFERRQNPENALAVATFCRWITEIYHHAQTTAFGAAGSFPDCGVESSVVVGGILATSADSEETFGFTHEIKLPSIRALRRVPGRELVQLKAGEDYFAAVRHWRNGDRSTRSVREDGVREALDYYAQEINMLAQRYAQPRVRRVVVNMTGGDANARLRQAFVSLLATGFTAAVNAVGFVAASLPGVVAGYQWTAALARDRYPIRVSGPPPTFGEFHVPPVPLV